MGGSESRCCADTAEKKSVSGMEGEEFRKNCESPFKATRIIHGDPRSPSQCIDRTPIEVLATPAQPKPLMRVQPMVDSNLRNRHATGQSENAKPETFSFDPRSPGPPDVTRTPITTKSIGWSSLEQPNRITTVAHVALLDPRSPSQEVIRTPLLIEESRKESEEIGLVISETPKKHQENVEGGTSNPSFSPDIGSMDPRSPTQGIQRTPVANLEKPDHKTDAVSARNLHDPRSPTTEVSRTPIGSLFSGHRELRRTVLMTNALMASPMSKKITQSCSVDIAFADDNVISDETVAKQDCVVEDDIPAILRCNFDFNNSCSSSMIASIGSEVDCISLNESLDDDDVSLNTIDTVEIDLNERHLRSGKHDASEEPNEELEEPDENKGENDVPMLQTTEKLVLPDILPSMEKLQNVEATSSIINGAGCMPVGDIFCMRELERNLSADGDKIKMNAEDEMAKDDMATTLNDRKSVDELPINSIQQSIYSDDGKSNTEMFGNKGPTTTGSSTENPSAEDKPNVPDIKSCSDEDPNDFNNVTEHVSDIAQELESHTQNEEKVSKHREQDGDSATQYGNGEDIEKSPIISTCNSSASIPSSEVSGEKTTYIPFVGRILVEPQNASDCTSERESQEVSGISSVQQKTGVQVNGTTTPQSSFASVEDASYKLCMETALEDSSSGANSTKNSLQESSEEIKQAEMQECHHVAFMHIPVDKTQGVDKDQRDRKPVRKLRTPTAVTHHKKKVHTAASSPLTQRSPSSHVSRSTSGRKASLLRRPKAKSASDDTRTTAGIGQENSKSLIKKPTRKSESKLVTPAAVRSPLAVLTNDVKAKGDANSPFYSSPAAKTTKLPKYQGTPPIAVNRSLSISFSGRSSSHSHSIERNKGDQRSFTSGKEN